jgi:hypothetical protein
MPNVLEEAIAFFRIVPELVTQHTECTRRVVKPLGNFVGRDSLHEEGTKSLVLSVKWLFGREKILGIGRWCYLIAMIDSHAYIILQSWRDVNM